MLDRYETTQAFWLSLRYGSECWEWQGSRTALGHGELVYGGRRWQASSLAWTATYGGIPEGLGVVPACGNASCCRPDHLLLELCPPSEGSLESGAAVLVG